MKAKKLTALLGLLLIASLVLVACGTGDATDEPSGDGPAAAPDPTDVPDEPDEPEVTEEPLEVDMGPITYYGTSQTDIPTLDPQVASDVVSINNIESLFVNLTNYDLETAEVVPEAATSWEVSDDGLVLTFVLHAGIRWHDGVAVRELSQDPDDYSLWIGRSLDCPLRSRRPRYRRSHG
ncbi:MAG: hypothetical protein IH859_05055 [Chloroflexi bacterium]|nr:hypothetical protein [Chloroflexota bacterium]